MFNVKIINVTYLSNDVRRVKFFYEDRVFPGRPYESCCDVSSRSGLVTYYDMGKAYTMNQEETSAIMSALKVI